jgi:LAS superfamily LD-carboxypeptidase LdcB
MADNGEYQAIGGGRFVLVDPNKFNNQYVGVKENDLYNFSVPLEDLCISVELKTNKKNRTLLIKDGSESSAINQGSGPSGIVMIPTGQKYNVDNNGRATPDDGKNDSAYFDKQNWLTTSYTNLSTDLNKDDEEVLGMTNIEISFDSQIAPMVAIDFIDPRGGAIFQNGGKSKYSVFFTLPYPLFELTVKGFYGRPVKYCLHLTKFNSRFNSQTGNFEISTKFVGYTYALLSDMIFGYLRAIGTTKEGLDLLNARGIIPLNDFLIQASSIDEKIKDAINNIDDEEFNNLKILQEIDLEYDNIIKLIDETALLIQPPNSTYQVTESNNSKIVIVNNPTGSFTTTGDGNVNDPENETKIVDFETKYKEIANKINGKIGDNNDLKIDVSKEPIVARYSTQMTPIDLFFSTNLSQDEKTSVDNFTTLIKQKYNVTTSEEVEEIVKALKAASINIQSNSNPLVKYYDFSVLNKNIQISQSLLAERIKEVRNASSLLLQEKLRESLNFDTSIRSIFEILTAHVDIFLELLYKYSKSAEESQPRKEQLKQFLANLDIPEKGPNDQTEQAIYPWPEYYELDEEKYLGSQPGPLTNPSVVDEIKFVDMLFEGLIKNRRVDEQIKSGINNEDQTWLTFNPADSIFYFNDKEDNNPYARLGDNPLPVDIARLFVLRFFAFSNFNLFLSDDDVNKFVTSESSLIIKRFKDNIKILQGLNQNFTNVDQLLNIKGKIGIDEGDKKEHLIVISGSATNDVTYNYIYGTILTNRDRRIIPISDSFNDAIYPDPIIASGSVETPKIYLSNVTFKNQDPAVLQIGDLPSDGITLSDVPTYLTKLRDKAFYFNIIKKEDYENGKSTGSQSTFESNNLSQLFDSVDKVSTNFPFGTGKYGVLDFTKIKREGIEKAFYTFFYDNAKYSGFVKSKDDITKSLYSTNNSSLPVSDIEEAYFKQNSDFFYLWDVDVNKAYDYDNIKNFNEIDSYIPDLTFQTLVNIPVGYEYDLSKNGLLGILGTVYVDKIHDISAPLFGSRFYYGQTTDEAKAFLFLHCFPWKGLVSNSIKYSETTSDKIGLLDPFNNYTINANTPILNIFQFRSGFIQAPTLWSAFIGGLLWRYLSDTDPITWRYTESTDGTIQPLIKMDSGLDYYPPDKNQYLKTEKSTLSMSFFTDEKKTIYKKIEDVILRLPDSVKITFLTAFNNFVQEFKTNIKPLFELKYGTSELNATNWTTAINDARTKAANNNGSINLTDIPFTANKPINEVFEIFTIFNSDKAVTDLTGGYLSWGNDYILFKYKKSSEQTKKLAELFTRYEYIANCSPLIWNTNKEYKGSSYAANSLNDCTGVNKEFKMSGTFYQKIADEFKKNIASEVGSAEGLSYTKDELEQIKFQIYRNCKAIYDKWIAGSGGPKDTIFQCCKTNKEKESVKSDYQSGGSLNLIDSFRFVNRSFSDIGDLSQINPLIISKQVVDNSNISLYQVIQRVLTDNNFVFTPLPSFINYNDPNDLKNMFRPIPCKELESETTTGPAFICTYVGQTSTKLDLQNNEISQHKNDSFDFTEETSIPSDFKDVKDPAENTCAAFVVRYGQQNQNIFKDINLDQEEFNETDESLQITDNIANIATKANRTFIGQNLYSVYSVRSYSAEIEMMGNSQIQPMMYFQLDNIPMFHGAYIITRVSHSIKPNYMSTKFKGTRIKKNATPIVDAQALYGSILDGYDLNPSTGTLGSVTKTYKLRPITKTILDNGGKNAYLTETFGQLKMKKVPDIEGITNAKKGTNTGSNDDNDNINQLSEHMLEEAADALEKMLKDFVAFAKSNNYKQKGGNYAGITSLYRNAKKQRSLVSSNSGPSGSVASVGTSYHGWGLAVDFLMIDENTGDFFSNSARNTTGFNAKRNLMLAWLYKNAWKYGFWTPTNLRNGGSVDEFWHYEYHGTSAVCLWKNSPDDIYGNRIEMPDDALNQLDPIVLNPKEPNGNRAVYDANSCEEFTISTGDGTNDSTKLTDKDRKQNMLTVKQYLKTFFLNKKYSEEDSKALTAGIMGNIFEESAFNPTITAQDTKGYSYGFIQWNSGAYPNAKADVGSTAQSQIEKVTDGYTAYFNDFISEYSSQSSVNGESKTFTAAFYFAKNVERCSYCVKQKGKEAYDNFKNGGYVTIGGKSVKVTPTKRSNSAQDFASRFDDAGDYLYWASDITNIDDYKEPITSINNTSGTQSSPGFKNIVTIGDSLSVGLSMVYKKVKKDPNLSVVGWGINKLITEIKKQQPNTTFDAVIISIGANDKWTTTQDKALTLLAEIDRVYPNAQRVFILNGTYGNWLGQNLIDNIWQKKITDYLNLFVNSGQRKIGQGGLIGTIVKSNTHPNPAANDPFYADKKSDLESKVYGKSEPSVLLKPVAAPSFTDQLNFSKNITNNIFNL